MGRPHNVQHPVDSQQWVPFILRCLRFVSFTCGLPICWCVTALHRSRPLCLYMYISIHIHICIYIHTYLSIKDSSHIYKSIHICMYIYIYSCMLCVFLCSFSSLFILATIIDRSKRCTTIYAIYAGVPSSLLEEDASSSSTAPGGSGDVRAFLRLGRLPVFTKIMARLLSAEKNSFFFLVPSSSTA